MKRAVATATREELLRSFPIEDAAAPGWYFRIEEVSNGVLRVAGRDAYGRAVSRQGSDEVALLRQAVADAADIISQTR